MSLLKEQADTSHGGPRDQESSVGTLFPPLDIVILLMLTIIVLYIQDLVGTSIHVVWSCAKEIRVVNPSKNFLIPASLQMGNFPA